MFDAIETEYGIAYAFARTENGIMVSLPKCNMTKVHPDYRGGPCVNFEWQVKE